jgi:hypothetical protein
MKIDFPDFPSEYLSNEKIRTAYAKARAYAIFYLEESEMKNEHDLTSPMVTAATHNLNLELESEKYRERCIQEISYIEGLLDEGDDFRNDLEIVRNELP